MSKVAFYCFSGTGNTRLVAQKVKEGLELEGHKTDYFEVKDKPVNPSAYDSFGVCFPVYDWSPPWPLRDLLKKWHGLLNGKPCFIVMDYAGEPVNACLKMMEDLEKTGAKVFHTSEIVMPESWTVVLTPKSINSMDEWLSKNPQPDPTSFGKEIGRKLKNGNIAPINKPRYKFSLYSLMIPFYTKTVLKMFYRVNLDKSKCVKCGACVEICPTGSIKINSCPSFSYPCAGCYACINHCPTQALESWATRGKIRYKPKEPYF
ncbi:MAG: 4Fe-4S binding protein [Caldisericales bacterium]|nr:4Fe-4S binding protein [Caldisericales bacterium]